LAVERETPVRMPHNERNVIEDEVPPAFAGAPSQLDNLIADLAGPRHVVIPDGPQMRGCGHLSSSAESIPSSVCCRVDVNPHYPVAAPLRASRAVTSRPAPPTKRLRKPRPLWMPWATASSLTELAKTVEVIWESSGPLTPRWR